MKLTKKFLGIAAVIAVIGFLALPLTGCPDEGDDSGSGTTTTTTGTETETQKIVYYNGDSIEEFAAWLAEQEEGVLCDVKLTLDDLHGKSNVEGSLGSVLIKNPKIKVKLDLSASTFTSIGERAFKNCNSLTSVTFQGTIVRNKFQDYAFYELGNLRDEFYRTDITNGTPGTYTTTAPVSSSSVWTKQD